MVYTGGPASGEPGECTRPEVSSVLWCSVDGHKVTGGPKTSGPHKEASTAGPVEWPSHEWSTQQASSRRPKREGQSTEWTNYGGPDEWTGHTGGPVSGELPECARRAQGDGWTSDER